MARVVLHIHSLGLGGAERVALDWLEWLCEDGHQVWLLLGSVQNQAFFSVPEGVNVVAQSLSTCTPSLPSFIWLRRNLREIKPHCVVGMTTRPALNVLLASCGQPWSVVVAERNYPPCKPLPMVWRVLRLYLYPRASVHLVQTERIGTWLSANNLAARIICLPNAVQWPLPEHEPRIAPSDCLPPGISLLMGVGTKPEQKGFDRLLLAFSRLSSQFPNWWLALPGLDPRSPQVQDLLNAIPGPTDWHHRVFFPGRIGTLASWYEQADLFALTSRYEGFPNVLLEAMAAGCPSLAIDCPTGPRELITHGVDGWLVDSVDDEQVQQHRLEAGLAYLMKNSEIRLQLGAESVHVRKRFSVPLIKQQFLNAINFSMRAEVMVFAPTRRSPTETFVRANLSQMPLRQVAYFGDEFGFACNLSLPRRLGQFSYGTAVLLSKIFTRFSLHRLATVFPSVVAWFLIQFHRPSVLLAEFGFHAVRMMDAALWSNLPLLVHFRGSDASADRRVRCLAERYRRLMRVASAFIVKSRPMQTVLEGFGAPSGRITISPSGANQDLFTGAAPEISPPTVLFVGRLVEKKAPLDALEAFALAIESLPLPARLLIVGEGPLREPLLIRIQQLGLEEQVEFLGYRTPEQVAVLMRQTRCLLLPSRTAFDGDSEGCPVVVLEAQVAGLPVVTTRHAGIPEVVLEDQTAFLADEGDIKSLSLGLRKLLSNPILAGRMGAAASSFARGRFTVDKHIESLVGVIKDLVRD